MTFFSYAENHTVVRSLFVRILQTWAGLTLVLPAGTIADLFDLMGNADILPQIVLVGLDEYPSVRDMLAIKKLVSEFPCVKVLVVSFFCQPQIIQLAIQHGAASWLHMDEDERTFTKTIHDILNNGYCVNKYAIADFFAKSNFSRDIGQIRITSVEERILKEIPSGLTYAQIAQKMNVSPKTIHCHRENLFVKLNVKSRQELAVYAIKKGYYVP